MFYGFSGGRELVEALADRAFVEAGHAAFDELATPDFEFVLVRGEVGEEGVYRGRDGVVEGMREWLSSFRSYVATAQAYLQRTAALAALTDDERSWLDRHARVPV